MRQPWMPIASSTTPGASRSIHDAERAHAWRRAARTSSSCSPSGTSYVRTFALRRVGARVDGLARRVVDA